MFGGKIYCYLTQAYFAHTRSSHVSLCMWFMCSECVDTCTPSLRIYNNMGAGTSCMAARALCYAAHAQRARRCEAQCVDGLSGLYRSISLRTIVIFWSPVQRPYIRWTEFFGRPCSAASYSICSILIVLVQLHSTIEYYRTSSHLRQTGASCVRIYYRFSAQCFQQNFSKIFSKVL